MFTTLIESSKHGAPRRLPPSGAVSLLGHVALGAAVVWATLRPAASAGTPAVPIAISWPEAADHRDDPGLPESISGPAHPLVEVPPLTPIGLSPIDAPVELDAKAFLRATSGGPRTTPESEPGAPWSLTAVDQHPALIAGPPLDYPESLRRAGIQGRVVVQVVVDTFGRAEPATLQLVESTSHAFDVPALDYVRRALFRPARVRGRALRVLVRVPIDFMLRRLQ